MGSLYAQFLRGEDDISNNQFSIKSHDSMELIFIYNAKSGFFNSVMDYVHKFVSPETYSCNLCTLTYDNTGKKNEWANYLNTLPIEVEFVSILVLRQPLCLHLL